MMNRREFVKIIGAAVGYVSFNGCGCFAESNHKQAVNILLICVDDLKPLLGCYGDSVAKTPNIDRLAARGICFDRAYCNEAICAPSRYNLMLGTRSTTTGIYGLKESFRQVYPNAVTLSQYFMRHGWRAESIGKVFHVGHGNKGDGQSWSEEPQYEPVVQYVLKESTGGKLTREEAFFTNQQLDDIPNLPRGYAWEKADVPDNAYSDGRIAEKGIISLRKANESGKPLFLALGFVKPHLPFCAPAKYWDMYDHESLKLAARQTPPDKAPKMAGKGLIEISNFEPIPDKQIFDDETQRTLIHGYYACTSYTDAQIGKVLDELDRLKMTENTIVLLWGDHGYHLGDLGYWTKHTNYEQANRIPLIISAPEIEKGIRNNHMAETVDIYPTLAELAGLPAPKVPQPMDGISLAPVLRDPKLKLKDHVYHAYPRGKHFGRAIRTERYRLVEWKVPSAAQDTAIYELYDYQNDSTESVNLADSKPKLLKQLRAILDKYPEAKPSI